MSELQQYITPDQQDAFFAALKAAGQLAVHKGYMSDEKGLSQDTPDPQAQAGISPDTQATSDNPSPDNSVDYSKIQSLFRDAASGHPIGIQEGDKMHPMDAIQQIIQNLNAPGAVNGPAAPAGVDHTGGPQVQRDSSGMLYAKLESTNPILKMLGMKQKVELGNGNYYDQVKAANAEKYLQSGLAQMPDGGAWVGKESAEQALMAKKGDQNSLNAPVTLQEALTLGAITDDQYRKLKSQGLKDTDTRPQREWGLAVQGGLLGVKKQQTAIASNKFEDMMNERFVKDISEGQQSPNTAYGKASNVLQQAYIVRQGLASRYDPKTDEYDLNATEVGDLQLATARILARAGAISNEMLDHVSQATAAGQVGKAATYLFGVNFRGSTQDVIRRAVQIVDKEGLASAEARDMYAAQASQAGAVLKRLNPALYNQSLNKAFGGIDYSALLAQSADAQSPNYLTPNISPISRTQAPANLYTPGYTPPAATPAVATPQQGAATSTGVPQPAPFKPAPYGETTVRKGKLYQWVPSKGKYMLKG